ncbi:MAG: LemA family protein [Crocinitomicaceae bacterium]
MSYGEDKFKAHIKAVVEAGLKDETITERPLTLDELKELAISMGMTSEEWDKLQLQAHEFLKAADDHLKARNFTEAIAKAEEATAINPYIENGNAVLAKAYLMLWLQTHENEHRDKAEFHARKELKVDPRDQIAVNVLSTIAKKRRILEGDKSNTKKIVIAIAAIVIALIIAGFIFSNGSSSTNDSLTTSSIDDHDYIKDQLIEAEEEVNSKWDYVQTAIERRNNLIPDLIGILSVSNESTQLNATIEDLQEKIKTAEGEEKFKLENDLTAAINEAKAIARQNGESENVRNLMMQIESSENRIAYEKKTYNEAVKAYNILLKKNQDNYPEYEIKPYFSSN